MLGLTELKKGTLIQLDSTPYQVIDYKHRQLGRGSAQVQTKLRNLLNGTVVSRTFKGSERVAEAKLDRTDVQYLYQQNQQAYFMESGTYEQLAVNSQILADLLPYLAEGSQLTALKFQNQIIDLELPSKVVLKVTQTEPGVKGDTSTTPLKPATLETGLELKVPLFIKPGDKIKVDTRTASYVERV